MKFLVALCVLSILGLACGSPLLQDCYYDDRGLCYKECEVGTHAYTTGCGPMTPEPTCENPHPAAGKGAICDYSACYCDEPTVRDSVSGKCVKLEECPKTPKEENSKEETPKKE